MTVCTNKTAEELKPSFNNRDQPDQQMSYSRIVERNSDEEYLDGEEGENFGISKGGPTDLTSIPVKDLIIVAFMLGLWLYSIALIVRAWSKVHLINREHEQGIGQNMWKFVLDYLHKKRKGGSNSNSEHQMNSQEQKDEKSSSIIINAEENSSSLSTNLNNKEGNFKQTIIATNHQRRTSKYSPHVLLQNINEINKFTTSTFVVSDNDSVKNRLPLNEMPDEGSHQMVETQQEATKSLDEGTPEVIKSSKNEIPNEAQHIQEDYSQMLDSKVVMQCLNEADISEFLKTAKKNSPV